ncbi:MAG: AMP-binding protein [Deltaproteobacteria bacterium]|jgi:acyl-CoA synthetase (AMP-forming)/AMP-acid ligase II/NAD-dependent dihydropyrimidine dehydrogenase PreA subunit|nr:AMP-binding protein [Deltaproteobacteria bacterium]
MAPYTNFNELITLRAAEEGQRSFITEPESGRALSFAELEKDTKVLLSGLRERGFRPGDRVALIFHNSISASLALLSVIASGGVAVPINPANTAVELSFLLQNSGARFVFTSPDLALELEQKIAISDGNSTLREGLVLYTARAFADAAGAREEKEEALPPDLALLLYTSGTTGVPKGVMLTQGNLLAECAHIRLAHRLTKEDKVLCLLPLYHINGLVVTLLTPLFTGLEVVMPLRFSAGRFWEWVRLHQPTWFSAVPTIYSILLSNPFPERAALRSLRFARSASSALPEAVLAEFERRTGVPLIESYGISEGGSQITSNPLPPELRKPGSVGLPFGNEVQVTGQDGRPVPPGVEGEVAVRGKNIAVAYFKNPEATRASFRKDWFFTGDLGSFDAQGYLFLRGRIKELINRAGEMISPREIDEVLFSYPGVELAAAVGVPHALYGEEVVAFVQMRAGEPLREKEIMAFCAEKLSAVKIPRRIYATDNFPKGPSGKIQRLKLRNIYLDFPESERVPERNAGPRQQAGSYDIHLDQDACKACGYCRMICPKGVYAQGGFLNKKGYKAFRAEYPENCVGCLRCFYLCPDFCLEVLPRDDRGARA